MRYPAYQRYKGSDIEWMGHVPAHWEVVSLRWVCRRYAGGTPDKADDSFWDEGKIPWINSGAVNQTLITEPSAYITEEGFARSSAKWIPAGALVMALAGQGKTKGMVAQLGITTTCNQSMAAIVPDERVDARFLFWWLSAHYHTIRNLAGGEQRDGLNLDILGAFPLPLLPKSEQVAIASFLDRKTTEIDALVAKKRALIEKLKEKRSALISRTVTRGLPPEAARTAGLEPNPRLKQSGVEWLGEVPEHWQSPPLGVRFRIELGKMLNEERVTGNFLVPYLRNIDVQWDRISFLNLPEMDIRPAEYDRYTIQPGDLLVCEGGEVGRCAVVPPVEELFGYQKALHRLRARSNEESVRFMYYVLCSYASQGVFVAGGNPNTIDHLTAEKLRRYRFPQPPPAEQRAIAHFLDRETARIDALVAKVEQAIECLQEYRTALITAAVTGKIDVRNVAQNAAEAQQRAARATNK